jgi:hypothetical protein
LLEQEAGKVDVLFGGYEVERCLFAIRIRWTEVKEKEVQYLAGKIYGGGGESVVQSEAWGRNSLLALTSAPFERNSLTKSSPSLRLTAIIKGVHPAPS